MGVASPEGMEQSCERERGREFEFVKGGLEIGWEKRKKKVVERERWEFEF